MNHKSKPQTSPPGDWINVATLPESHDITPEGLAAVGYVGEVVVEWNSDHGRPQRWATNNLEALHMMNRHHATGAAPYTLHSVKRYTTKRAEQ